MKLVGWVRASASLRYAGVLECDCLHEAILALQCRKAASGDLLVVDDLALDAIKTKPMAAFLKAVGADTKALVVTAENNEVVVKSAANIPGVLVTFANLINVYDILNAKKLVVDKAALAKIEEVFA